jgi:hypothetical protein
MDSKPVEIDFRLIGEELDRLLTAFKNATVREWPSKWNSLLGASLIVQGSVRITSTTYDLIRFLCKKPSWYRDGWQKLEFVTSVPPLTRSILDVLFAIVFLSTMFLRTQSVSYKAVGARCVRKQSVCSGTTGQIRSGRSI